MRSDLPAGGPAGADRSPAPARAAGGWWSGRAVDGGIDEIPLPGDVPGRLWLCGKHHIGPDVAAAMARVGATSVVCLNERHELEDRFPDYVGWLAPAHDEGRARWHPIHDLSAPPIDEFATLVRAVVDDLRRGERVIVHCGAGIGRAGTLAVGVLVATGLEPDEARATVSRHRPMAGPEVGAQAALVEEWARRCATS